MAHHLQFAWPLKQEKVPKCSIASVAYLHMQTSTQVVGQESVDEEDEKEEDEKEEAGTADIIEINEADKTDNADVASDDMEDDRNISDQAHSLAEKLQSEIQTYLIAYTGVQVEKVSVVVDTAEKKPAKSRVV